MSRIILVLVLASAALVWLADRMRRSVARLATGHAGDRLLDLRPFGYSRDQVLAYFVRLGPERRRHYLKRQIRLDAAFAFAYGIAGAAWGFWIAAVLSGDGRPRLSYVAMAAGFAMALAAAADLDEGVRIGKLLKGFPHIDATAVARAARATRLKWALLAVALVGLLFTSAVAAVSWIKA